MTAIPAITRDSGDLPSLAPQRDQRVNFRHPARGHVTGGKADGQEHQRHTGKRDGIVDRGFQQQRAHHPREDERHHNACGCGGGSGGARCLSLGDYVAGMGPTGRPRRPSVLVLAILYPPRVGSPQSFLSDPG